MTQTIAFLRAINVGGHTVKMDALRQLFEEMSFQSVETFIASGNVIFETTDKLNRVLEEKIESALKSALGYEVATFLRTPAELAEVIVYPAFPADQVEAARAYNVAFMGSTVDDGAVGKLMALQSEGERFHVHGRELYWLSTVGQGQSKISNATFEKALGRRSTLRQVSTMKKLSAKYPPTG